MIKKQQRIKTAGFTLIEVLVALLVLAIALTAIIKSVNDNIRGSSYLQDKTLSQWVALNVINSMQAGLIPAPTATTSQQGTMQMRHQTWFWQADLEETTGYTARITVIVKKYPSSNAITHFTGFLLIPPQG